MIWYVPLEPPTSTRCPTLIAPALPPSPPTVWRIWSHLRIAGGVGTARPAGWSPVATSPSWGCIGVPNPYGCPVGLLLVPPCRCPMGPCVRPGVLLPPPRLKFGVGEEDVGGPPVRWSTMDTLVSPRARRCCRSAGLCSGAGPRRTLRMAASIVARSIDPTPWAPIVAFACARRIKHADMRMSRNQMRSASGGAGAPLGSRFPRCAHRRCAVSLRVVILAMISTDCAPLLRTVNGNCSISRRRSVGSSMNCARTLTTTAINMSPPVSGIPWVWVSPRRARSWTIIMTPYISWEGDTQCDRACRSPLSNASVSLRACSIPSSPSCRYAHRRKAVPGFSPFSTADRRNTSSFSVYFFGVDLEYREARAAPPRRKVMLRGPSSPWGAEVDPTGYTMYEPNCTASRDPIAWATIAAMSRTLVWSSMVSWNNPLPRLRGSARRVVFRWAIHGGVALPCGSR